MLQSSAYQASFHFPPCSVARISLLVPSPPTTVHKHVSNACWVGVRWVTDFFWCTVVTGDVWVHVVTSRNKHVLGLPGFIWYDVQLNLGKCLSGKSLFRTILISIGYKMVSLIYGLPSRIWSAITILFVTWSTLKWNERAFKTWC